MSEETSSTVEEVVEVVAAEEAQVVTVETPVEAPRRKKVAILGFTNSCQLAPFGDDEFEIWGLNELYTIIKPDWTRTRWFDIHNRAVYEADKKRVSDHVENMKRMPCPIYMHQHWDDIPNSVPYPLAEISAAFPNPAPGWKPYLTNTISYMLALAIYEGFEEIHVYGVDMSHDTEYGTQKPSCEYFMGVAHGRGIKTYVPTVADLLKTVFLYGYEELEAIGFEEKLKSRKVEMQTKIDELSKQIEQLSEARHQYLGAMQDNDHLLKNWSPIKHVT